MNIDKLKSFLELQIIWKDDNMFELKVTASNGRYFGITEVYDTTESLFNFSQMLLDFPRVCLGQPQKHQQGRKGIKLAGKG